MSRMAALVFLAVSMTQPPPADTGITAEQAMTNYRAMLKGATPSAEAPDCAPSANGEIVVCHRDVHPKPRLSMPEAEPGEVVHHPGEPPRASGVSDAKQCQHNCEASPAPATWGRLFRILKGEDPDP
jgi:hypothetical protein